MSALLVSALLNKLAPFVKNLDRSKIEKSLSLSDLSTGKVTLSNLTLVGEEFAAMLLPPDTLNRFLFKDCTAASLVLTLVAGLDTLSSPTLSIAMQNVEIFCEPTTDNKTDLQAVLSARRSAMLRYERAERERLERDKTIEENADQQKNKSWVARIKAKLNQPFFAPTLEMVLFDVRIHYFDDLTRVTFAFESYSKRTSNGSAREIFSLTKLRVDFNDNESLLLPVDLSFTIASDSSPSSSSSSSPSFPSPSLQVCSVEVSPLTIRLRPSLLIALAASKSAYFYERRMSRTSYMKPSSRPTSRPGLWWTYAIACVVSKPTSRSWTEVKFIGIMRRRFLFLSLLLDRERTAGEERELQALKDKLPLECLFAFSTIVGAAKRARVDIAASSKRRSGILKSSLLSSLKKARSGKKLSELFFWPSSSPSTVSAATGAAAGAAAAAAEAADACLTTRRPRLPSFSTRAAEAAAPLPPSCLIDMKSVNVTFHFADDMGAPLLKATVVGSARVTHTPSVDDTKIKASCSVSSFEVEDMYSNTTVPSFVPPFPTLSSSLLIARVPDDVDGVTPPDVLFLSFASTKDRVAIKVSSSPLLFAFHPPTVTRLFDSHGQIGAALQCGSRRLRGTSATTSIAKKAFLVWANSGKDYSISVDCSAPKFLLPLSSSTPDSFFLDLGRIKARGASCGKLDAPSKMKIEASDIEMFYRDANWTRRKVLSRFHFEVSSTSNVHVQDRDRMKTAHSDHEVAVSISPVHVSVFRIESAAYAQPFVRLISRHFRRGGAAPSRATPRGGDVEPTRSTSSSSSSIKVHLAQLLVAVEGIPPRQAYYELDLADLTFEAKKECESLVTIRSATCARFDRSSKQMLVLRPTPDADDNVAPHHRPSLIEISRCCSSDKKDHRSSKSRVVLSRLSLHITDDVMLDVAIFARTALDVAAQAVRDTAIFPIVSTSSATATEDFIVSVDVSGIRCKYEFDRKSHSTLGAYALAVVKTSMTVTSSSRRAIAGEATFGEGGDDIGCWSRVVFRDSAIALCSPRTGAAEGRPTVVELPIVEIQTNAQWCFGSGSEVPVAVAENTVRIAKQVVIVFHSFEEGKRAIDICRHVIAAAKEIASQAAKKSQSTKRKDDVVFTFTGYVDSVLLKWLSERQSAFAVEESDPFISIELRYSTGSLRGSSCGAWFGEADSVVSARLGKSGECIANKLVVKLLLEMSPRDASPSLSWSIAGSDGAPITFSNAVRVGWRICCVVGYTFVYELACSKIYAVARELVSETIATCSALNLLEVGGVPTMRRQQQKPQQRLR